MSHTDVQLKDGTNLRVWLSGNEDKTKPLLVALHGAPGLSDHETETVFSFLTDKFRVLIYDARGSGRSDLKGPYTNEQWADDVDELREWAEAETIILAGYSYGGFIAQTYALRYPCRLSGLILRDTFACGPRGMLGAITSCATSPRVSPDLSRLIRLWSGTCLSREDTEKGLAEILPIYSPEKDEEAPAVAPAFDLANGGLGLHWETHNAAWSYSVPRFDTRCKLATIQVPTLVLVGRHDPICPLEEAQEIVGAVPKSELVVFEKSGHNPALDEPEAFKEEVGKFLEKHVQLCVN